MPGRTEPPILSQIQTLRDVGRPFGRPIPLFGRNVCRWLHRRRHPYSSSSWACDDRASPEPVGGRHAVSGCAQRVLHPAYGGIARASPAYSPFTGVERARRRQLTVYPGNRFAADSVEADWTEALRGANTAHDAYEKGNLHRLRRTHRRSEDTHRRVGHAAVVVGLHVLDQASRHPHRERRSTSSRAPSSLMPEGQPS